MDAQETFISHLIELRDRLLNTFAGHCHGFRMDFNV
jgi:hypothetical protein